MNTASRADTASPAARYRLENIEARRASLGIDDDELREQVRTLKTGDRVCLTLCAGETSQGGEVVVIRITVVEKDGFRGELVDAPKAKPLSGILAGSVFHFTAAHVHSLFDEALHKSGTHATKHEDRASARQ